MDLNQYKKTFLDFLSKHPRPKKPNNLYDPIEYILNIGGKRIRPILVLFSCEIFGGDINKALNAAMAIEMFHNFTLIHDDIMDNASLRRGKETVHIKWDKNTGILSGDALMILSYQQLEPYRGETFSKLYTLFNITALKICEGQQYDMDFELKNDISLDDYLKMISNKTAILLGCALQMGAIIANANDKDVEYIYNYGLNLGRAFQLQDDYLDTYGSKDFGKKVGGDILENKKTFLFIKTLELTSVEDREELLQLYSNFEISDAKIKRVIEIFNKYNTKDLLLAIIKDYTQLALSDIDNLSISDANKKGLIKLSDELMNRKI